MTCEFMLKNHFPSNSRSQISLSIYAYFSALSLLLLAVCVCVYIIYMIHIFFLFTYLNYHEILNKGNSGDASVNWPCLFIKIN